MRAARFNELRALRAAYLLVAVGILSIYSVIPPARPAAAAALGALALGGIVTGVRRLRPVRRVGWLLVAAAVAVTAAGTVTFALLARHAPAAQTYPSLPDVFFLLVYPPLAIGLILLGRPALASRDSGMLLDTAGLSLAGSLLIWITVVHPILEDLDLSLAGRIVAVASWVGSVTVLAAAARVAIDWYRNPALWLLNAGVATFLLGYWLYAWSLAHTGLSTGGVADLGLQAFIGLCGAAALVPAMADIRWTDQAHHPLGPARITVLAITMLVGPTALLLEATSGPVTTGIAIAVVSAGLGILAVIRLVVAGRAHRRRMERERVAQAVSGELVAATSSEEVVSSVELALRSMLPKGAGYSVHIAETPAQACVLEPVPDESKLRNGQSYGELTVPLPAAAAIGPQRTGAPPANRPAMRFRAPMNDLIALQPTLEALAEQAGSALHRVDLVARLRADERERYFRTLVLTSRDVTLISRGGRVEYATPSARDMFGRDVQGEQLHNLIGRTAERLPLAGDGKEGTVRRPDGSTLTVLTRERDLSHEPTVHGVVTTLRDVTAERELQRDLAFRASHDTLTGLANAEVFNRELDRAAQHYRAAGSSGWAALFVDLDDFKMVNDTYGHEIGDRLLTVVARRIESGLRAGDLAARIGGDEFAALLLGLPDERAGQAVAQRIADALAAPAIIEGIGLSTQASIGLAYSESGKASETLLREADSALYTAKAHGKGRWAQYRAGMTTPSRRYLHARQRIERAMVSNDLRLYYQPIVELDSGTAVGFEALLRLDDGGPAMSPTELIKVADDTGLINELGGWTLRRALSDLDRLNAGESTGRYVSVNVSARQLRQPDFVDRVRAYLSQTQADPTKVVLEITEDLLVGNEYDRAWDFLAELRRDGLRVAIDDYGTGYASLSYLRQPGIDLIKIDKSFVAEATTPRGRALLRHLIGRCHPHGRGHKAEGVRDTASRDVLLELGCELGQGHLYARALPLDAACMWSRAEPAGSLRR